MFPFISQLIDFMILDKHKFTDIVLRKAIEHNKKTYENLQQLIENAIKSSKSISAVLKEYDFYENGNIISFRDTFNFNRNGLITNIVNVKNKSEYVDIKPLITTLNSLYYKIVNITMGLFGLFKKKSDETKVGNVEDFISLTRVYFQSVIATNLGITNIRFLPDVANFKRLFKIPTQGGKLGLAEKSASRKMLMQDYGLNDNFFKEIDASVKRNCRTQNDIQSYLFMYQGFSNDLMMLMGNLMQWKFRMPSIFKKALYGMTQKTVHDVCTKTVWKADDVHKTAMAVRQYKERLGYSEQWMTDYVYNIVLLAKKEPKRKNDDTETKK